MVIPHHRPNSTTNQRPMESDNAAMRNKMSDQANALPSSMPKNGTHTSSRNGMIQSSKAVNGLVFDAFMEGSWLI